MKILGLAGSLREGSYNKQLLSDAVAILKSHGKEVTVVDLQNYPMPLYDADLEAEQGMPEQARAFRLLLIESDVILLASPEYNASIPAVLKNAIDWASRSEEGKPSYQAFEGKTFILLGASPSKRGGARAQAHLIDILKNLKAIIAEKRVCIPEAHLYFADANRPKNQALEEALSGCL